MAFSFTDDAGNQEVSGYTTGGVNVRDPDASLNERRTQEEYSVFQQYLTANSITEGSIPLLLGDHYSDVSKWGSWVWDDCEHYLFSYCSGPTCIR